MRSGPKTTPPTNPINEKSKIEQKSSIKARSVSFQSLKDAIANNRQELTLKSVLTSKQVNTNSLKLYGLTLASLFYLIATVVLLPVTGTYKLTKQLIDKRKKDKAEGKANENSADEGEKSKLLEGEEQTVDTKATLNPEVKKEETAQKSDVENEDEGEEVDPKNQELSSDDADEDEGEEVDPKNQELSSDDADAGQDTATASEAIKKTSEALEAVKEFGMNFIATIVALLLTPFQMLAASFKYIYTKAKINRAANYLNNKLNTFYKKVPGKKSTTLLAITAALGLLLIASSVVPAISTTAAFVAFASMGIVAAFSWKSSAKDGLHIAPVERIAYLGMTIAAPIAVFAMGASVGIAILFTLLPTILMTAYATTKASYQHAHTESENATTFAKYVRAKAAKQFKAPEKKEQAPENKSEKTPKDESNGDAETPAGEKPLASLDT